MSHYIQDNQVVIETKDNKFLLFTKGGDNNTFSFNNRRCTSWSYLGYFNNKLEYDTFITDLMLNDISGGSWQFNSLKNKTFKGHTEYENIIFGRFDRAWEKAIKCEWSFSDVNEENIIEFEEYLIELLKKNKFSVKEPIKM